LIVLGVLLAGSAAFAAAGSLRPRSPAGFALTAYVLLVAEVVVAIEGLSIVHAVSETNFLLFELGWLVVGLGAAQVAGGSIPWRSLPSADRKSVV